MFSIYTVTWNVKGEQPKCDLSQLLAISDQSADNSHGLADIYVIGLQEVSLRPANIFFTEPWIESFDSVFKQLDYVRLKSVRLVGIVLVVYTKRQYMTKIRSLEVNIG